MFLLSILFGTLSYVLVYVFYIVILVFLAFGFKYQHRSSNQAIADFFKYM